MRSMVPSTSLVHPAPPVLLSHKFLIMLLSFQNPDFEENEYMYNDLLSDDVDDGKETNGLSWK